MFQSAVYFTTITEEKKEEIRELPDYLKVPNSAFKQMWSAALDGADKIVQCLDTAEKVEFVRQYAYLIHRLFYVQLQQEQWDYYYHVGVTENIWNGRVSKKWAKENSICYIYGRSSTLIEQRRKKVAQQLLQAGNTLKEFEEQSLLKWISENGSDPPFNLQIMSSAATAFVRKGQHKLRRQFEQNKRMLALDSMDHRLVQTFYDLIPSQQQVCVNGNDFTRIEFFFSSPPCYRFVQQNSFGNVHKIKIKWMNKSRYSSIDYIQTVYHLPTIFSIIQLILSRKCSLVHNLLLSIKVHVQHYLLVV
jgi:hypothetical protein